MNNTTNLSSAAYLKELGKTVIAARVVGGKVPANCMGVFKAGEEIKHYRAGDAVNIPSYGKLWWVHGGPYVLDMAPVESAPEAGVRLLLEVPAIQEKVPKDLVDWLDTRRGHTWTVRDVAAELRGHMYVPTCMQLHERQKMAQLLSSSVLLKKGLQCNILEMIDLYPAVNCAAMPEEIADPVEKSVRQIEADEGDDPFGRRLFIELPLLANRLRSFPMPKDKAVLAAHLKLLRRFEILAATTGRLPELGELFGRNPVSPKVARRLHMEARRAVQKLDEAWGLLGCEPEELIQPVWQRRFARKLAGIEESIARRRAPWWEVV